MKRLDADIRAIDRPLEKRPKVFNPVCVDLPVNVLFSVIDYAVNIIGVEIVVRPERIAIDHRTGLNVRINRAAQRLALSVRDDDRADFAVTLKQPHHGHLTLIARRSLKSAGLNAAVHVTRLAADESFIDLYVTRHLFEKRAALHSKTDAVVHEPRSFLGDAKRAGDLVTANTVFAVCDHPYSREPLIQTERRILEDGPDFNGELPTLVRALTLPLVLLLKKRYVFAPASRTDNTIGPTARNKVAEAILRIREIDDCLLKRFRGCFVRHDEGILLSEP